MNFKELDIKKCYNSDRDNPLQDFYIPVLSLAKGYKRITGSFASGILAKAAQGIAGLINNKGKMQLIAGVQISEEDYRAIEKSIINPEAFITNLLNQEIGDIENYLRNDHVEALAWMLANERLEMKIGIVPPGNLSHMKVGIVEDMKGNKLSFSGSNNETPSGWQYNVEEFKVFCNWRKGERRYFEDDENKFNTFWEGRARRVKITDLPRAIKEGLIQRTQKGGAPRLLKKQQSPKEGVEKLIEINLTEKKLKEIKPYEHQRKAVNKWIENNYRGILEMATGTGKTITALACINSINLKLDKRCWVIAAPFSHLIEQWEESIDEVRKRGKKNFFDTYKGLSINKNVVIAGGSINKTWRRDLANKILDLKNGLIKDLYICVTHVTSSSTDFISSISDINFPIGIIIDEVHRIGSEHHQEALIDKYKYRLGLSATPVRWMDEEGTDLISKYFGGVVFQFTIGDALKTINPATRKPYLTPYIYRPRFIYLTDDETAQYNQLTRQISRLAAIKNKKFDTETILQRLREKRADIIKSATNKLPELKNILGDIKREFGEIKKTFVYCNSDGVQLGEAQEVLTNLNIISQQFTGKEDPRKRKGLDGISERQKIINDFISDRYQVLVAMKCLDEGIDVPDARIGIILASTQNPREYIQRRGRILRAAPGKKRAYIYDLMVLPSMDTGSDDSTYWKKELERFEEFAKDSDNNAECINKIIEVEKKLGIL